MVGGAQNGSGNVHGSEQFFGAAHMLPGDFFISQRLIGVGDLRLGGDPASPHL